ncbi:ATP-dependent DNA helicase RecG [Paraliobacillus quinghaiensis]|uniref:ATP-dependent DNA helicase RecG n=1 Tax=Paraliobacillus quinghaiensis TaxID=470815 RepID=A0A917TFU4_9BACI|nr:ATP-dependent DNA helicase RecG [Paraliobacillus quinghaiensis]GGM21110.1 ATP-dependent DNA helicase RecG [Paraliobacillus quinghaiensis]
MNQPIEKVKGVGQALQEHLGELGILTLEDLLFYFPNRYDNYEIKPLSELIHDEKVTIEGEIIGEPNLSYYGRKKSRLTLHLQVEDTVVKGVMFNRAFAKKQLQQGDTVTFTGKWDQHRLQITIDNYKKGKAKLDDPIQPVYPMKSTIKPLQFKKIIKNAIEQYGDNIVEVLPPAYLENYKLLPRNKALKEMHFPSNFQLLKHAKRRFVYEELLLFQLKMQVFRKKNRERTKGNSQLFDQFAIDQFITRLPFALTRAQQRSLDEILTDLRSPYRMNRLLQGDVGSGKTAVAAICLYASITAGKQGAIMVPTEILAEQHYASLTELFEGYANVVLLTGSIKGKKRKERLELVKEHQVDIIIGTHALIQDEVIFSNLGTVIVDEQHRFGVNQRKALRDKGIDPDVLFMTATPIPRTLAITSYGDMDVSQIDEMPVGRKPVETYWVKESMLPRLLQFIQKEVNNGHQAYVICPLIEESDKLDIQNAVDLYQQLQQVYGSAMKVGLLHGRLHNDEKEAVMQEFATNDVQVLVSTTVVEVGVNVPNATVMLIYDAERFGLSQLHQLRGRVGRGKAQSYCILVADPKGEVGKERMKIMTETINGFELAEQDLQLRGPGDFFGKKQSGLPEFKVADIVQDYRALETARNDAQTIIYQDLLSKDPSYHALKEHLEKELNLKSNTFD